MSDAPPTPADPAATVTTAARAPEGTPWLSGLLIFVAAATPVLAYVGNLGFAPLVALAGVCAVLIALRAPRPKLTAIAPFAVLVLWALVSLIWTPVRPPALTNYKALESFTGLKLVLQLPLYGAFIIAAGRVSPGGARRATLVLAIGLVVCALVVVLEGLAGEAMYLQLRHAVHQTIRPDFARRNVARAAYPLALLLWPSLLAFSKRRWAGIALAVLCAAAALLLKVDAPIVALVLGAGAWLVVSRFGRAGVMGMMGVAAAYFALAPLLVRLFTAFGAQHAVDAGKASWGARTAIWRFVTDRIFERPLLGWGLDASRAFPDAIPLHPHDASLQLWLELGAPGAALGALCALAVFAGVERLRQRDSMLAGAAAACAVAYLAIGALSFGVWQEWWIALGALAAGVILLCALTRGSLGKTAPF